MEQQARRGGCVPGPARPSRAKGPKRRAALGPERVAPTGVGARFRVNAPQAAALGGATYLPGRGAF